MDNLRANGVLCTVVVSTCSYEVVAVASRGRLPTVTALCAGRPWLAGIVLGVLGADLLWHNPRRISSISPAVAQELPGRDSILPETFTGP